MSSDGPSESSDSPLFVFFNEIGIISQLTSAIFEKSLPEGLNTSQFSVLNWFIRVDSQATPGRLATAFQVTGGAMTNTLKKLQAKGLITIEPDPKSGRKKRVTITDQGREVREKAIASSSPLFSDFAKSFSMTKIEKQVEELRKVRQYLDDYRFREQ